MGRSPQAGRTVLGSPAGTGPHSLFELRDLQEHQGAAGHARLQPPCEVRPTCPLHGAASSPSPTTHHSTLHIALLSHRCYEPPTCHAEGPHAKAKGKTHPPSPTPLPRRCYAATCTSGLSAPNSIPIVLTVTSPQYTPYHARLPCIHTTQTHQLPTPPCHTLILLGQPCSTPALTPILATIREASYYYPHQDTPFTPDAQPPTASPRHPHLSLCH